MRTGDNIFACVTKSGSNKSAEVLLHDNARPHMADKIKALLQKFRWEVLSHPPYSPDLSPCNYAIFGPLRKGSERQTINLGQRHQAVHAELVHNAALRILRDSHSLPCVTVGQVPQQPGPVFRTYRYWFLFLGLRLVSFLMSLIKVIISNVKIGK